MEMKRLLDPERGIPAAKIGEDLPIRVAEDWGAILTDSEKMADVIDRHLDFESKLQGRELRPITLCPEQRVNMMSDLATLA